MVQQSKNSFKRNIAKMSVGAFILALALSFSAYTNSEGVRQVTYYIQDEDSNGNYIVSTTGSCGTTPVEPCRFTTNLSPDGPGGTFSPEYLEENEVPVSLGTRP